MKRVSTTSLALAPTDTGAVGKAWDEVSASFDRFCLAAGVDALGAMMEKDAEEACGARHVRSEGRRGHRWGRTQGKIGFHAGKVAVERPRVRDLAGQEFVLPSWDRAVAEDWLGKWAKESAQEEREQHPILDDDIGGQRKQVESDVLVVERVVRAISHLMEKPQEHAP